MHNYSGTGRKHASVQRWRTFPSDTGAFLRASTYASANLISTSNFPLRKVHYHTICSVARALYNATTKFRRLFSDGRAEASLHFRSVALPGACIHYHSHRPSSTPPGVATGCNKAPANRLSLAPQTFIHIHTSFAGQSVLLCMHPTILITCFVSMVSTGFKAESLSSPSRASIFYISAFPGPHQRLRDISGSRGYCSSEYRSMILNRVIGLIRPIARSSAYHTFRRHDSESWRAQSVGIGVITESLQR